MPFTAGYPAPTRCGGLSGFVSASDLTAATTTPVFIGINPSSLGSTTRLRQIMVAPRAGYVSGISLASYGATATGSATAQVYVNDQVVPTLEETLNGANKYSSMPFSDQAFMFSRLDCLTMAITTSSWVQVSGGVHAVIWVAI